jgi:hypothetical protein
MKFIRNWRRQRAANQIVATGRYLDQLYRERAEWGGDPDFNHATIEQQERELERLRNFLKETA